MVSFGRCGPAATSAIEQRDDLAGLRFTPNAPCRIAVGSRLDVLRDPLSAHLAGHGIETVPEVDEPDRHNERTEGGLVVVPCGFLPDLVGNRVGPVAEPCGGLTERERRAFRVGVVRSLPPGGDGKDALVRLSKLLEHAEVHVDAHAASIDLAGAHVDELERSEEHTSELQSLAYLVCRLLL